MINADSPAVTTLPVFNRLVAGKPRYSRTLFLLTFFACILYGNSYSQCLVDITDALPYTLTESGQAAGFPATNAFNNSNDAFDGWQENRNVAVGNESWVRVVLTSGAKLVKGYSITAMDYTNGAITGNNIAPMNWKFQAFNGVTWVTLDVRAGIAFTGAGQTRVFSFANATAYSTYRLFISETFKTTSTVVGLAEMQIFEDVCLTGTVFNNTNKDRVPVYNAVNDAPLSGVKVSIVNETLGSVVATTNTNAAGVYSFTSANIPSAGNFSVMVTPPAGKYFVSESAKLLNSLVTLSSPEEEPATGAVFFDYHQNQQVTFPSVSNRMLFAGGNLDFGLYDASPGGTLVCGGTGSVGSNLITAGNNGTFGTDAGVWTTEHPHQKAFTVAASTLYNSLPVANTGYIFSNTQANPGVNNSGVLYNEGYYTVTSYEGTVSDFSDQPYLASLLNSYNGSGFRKTYGATTGDAYDRFLAVNGSSTGGVPFFTQPGIALTGGTSYSLSFFGKHADSYADVVNIGNINDAPVVAQITNNSGSIVATANLTLLAPTSYTQDRPETPWQFCTTSFVAPGAGGPFTVSLLASSSAVAGNDFYIDNITLTACSSVMLLPLDIVSFTAVAAPDNTIQLNWEIANPEAGITVVEYSTDGKRFEPLTSMELQTTEPGYHFTHKAPGQPHNYYRVKVVTSNGRVVYSPVREISLGQLSGRVSLYPNPVSNSLHISGGGEISGIEITDASGKTVGMLKNVNDMNATIDVSGWSKGYYFVKITSRTETSIHKIFVSR